MPRMMAYLGGDSDTLAARRAKDKDIRIAVEYPDHDRMLVFSVMQTGEILLAWTKVRGSEASDELQIIGKVVELEDSLEFVLGAEDWAFHAPTTEPVEFNHSVLRVVPDTHEYEDGEVF